MKRSMLRYFHLVIACVLALVFTIQSSVAAQIHVVSPEELEKAALATTQARQKNSEVVNSFLMSPAAQKQLRSALMEPSQVKHALSSLSDEELATLANRAETAQKDFAAGTLTNRDLLYLVLGFAALTLIIVAVR